MCVRECLTMFFKRSWIYLTKSSAVMVAAFVEPRAPDLPPSTEPLRRWRDICPAGQEVPRVSHALTLLEARQRDASIWHAPQRHASPLLSLKIQPPDSFAVISWCYPLRVIQCRGWEEDRKEISPCLPSLVHELVTKLKKWESHLTYP